MTIVPRWEWRTFGGSFGAADRRFDELPTDRVAESDDLYMLSPESDASVKVRDGLMDVKHLQHVNDDGLEQWMPVMKATFPLNEAELVFVLNTLRVPAPELGAAAYSLDDLTRILRAGSPGTLVVNVHKRREHYVLGGCLAERAEMRAQGATTRTVAVESEDPTRVVALVRELGLGARRNICVARGLKALLGVGARRYAVIDVGTNSIKFHIGERRADGDWQTIVDRAEVTRLGEGLAETGRLGPAAIERSADAVTGMVEEARRAGAAQVVAVGTAGLRTATNAADFLHAVRTRCGVEVEVIPAEEERRLAYLATTSALGTPAGSVVVFDTGGGSSQFTFSHDGHIDDAVNVNVGAARFTERFGLDGAVAEETVAAAQAAIAGELAELEKRATPDAVIAMGGAVTNLAAVKHELATYDPDTVQGTVLDRAEIDRQIELYRSRTGAERRELVGLQPNRAEVILAGACIVRTVLTLLRRESLTVSDRGLRYGVLIDRFA